MEDKPRRQSWTFRVSRTFIRRKDISAAEKMTAIAILGYANKDGLCCPTMIQLGQDMGMHPDTVKTHTKALRDADVLSWAVWTDEFGHKRRTYTLCTEAGRPSERLFIPPKEWDGLGGKQFDGRRTLQNP